jgi:hypothetical protein
MMGYEIIKLAILLVLVLTGGCISGEKPDVGTGETSQSVAGEIPDDVAALEIKLLGNVQESAPGYLTVADIEELPLIEYSVNDPVIGGLHTYSGVTLKDLVETYAKPTTKKTTITAIDEYKIEFTKDEWDKWDIILATRTDGEYMNIEGKGPAKIVMPYDTAEGIDKTAMAPKWIWQIDMIEFLE